jgi:hypothetical protein
MPANITPTSFSTGPDNKAVVVDVYKTPPLTPVNNQTGTVNSGVLDQVTGSNDLLLSSLQSLSKNYAKTGTLVLDHDALSKSLATSFGVTAGSLKSVSANALNSVLKGTGFYDSGIGSVVNGIAQSATGNTLDQDFLGGLKTVSLAINGTKQIIKDIGDIDSLSEISGFLSGLVGNSEFAKIKSLTEIAGIVKGINDFAVQYEISGVIDQLLKDLDDDDKSYTSALITSGLNTADANTVNSLLSYLTASQILAANPNIISLLVSGFSASTTYPDASAEAAAYLNTTLEKLDKNWHSVSTSNGFVSNLAIFKDFSAFAKASYIIAGDYKPELAIADGYTSKSIVALANEFYPYIGLTE